MADHAVDITSRTRLLAVIGHPVAHSLSPRIHNAALRSQGLDFVYVAFDVPSEALRPAVEGLRSLGVRGANITVPHKQDVLPLMDALDPLAEQVGAVNTIVNEEGRLVGYNTDVAGFAAALRRLLPGGAQGKRCLVAGAGGAARAVVAVLVADGADMIWIANRTRTRAEELCAVAKGWGDTPCGVLDADSLVEVGKQADIVVNATSIGLDRSVKTTPVPVDTFTSRQVVVDLVYGRSATEFVSQARARGADTVDGLEMLLMQAASSYALWTGVDAPLDIMRSALGGTVS